MKWLLLLLLFFPLAPTQTYTCTTAFTHVHTDIREGQITVSSWSGCTVVGTIGGVSKQLWADGTTCPLRTKVPGVFQVRYDAACGQVLTLSESSLPPWCPPTPTPTPQPTPSPTATPTPTPVATPTPTATPAPTPKPPKSCKLWPPWKIVNCF